MGVVAEDGQEACEHVCLRGNRVGVIVRVSLPGSAEYWMHVS